MLSALSIQRAWRRQLASVDRQNVANVRAISVAIDQEIDNTTAALDVLGALHALDAPDLAAFDSLASRLIVRRPDWSAVILSDLSGRVLAVTPAAGGTDERVGAAEDWARKVEATKKPFVSNMFEIPGTRGHFMMVAIPVVRGNRVTMALAAQLRSDSFGAILRQQQAPPDGVVAVVDGAHRIVARSKQEESIVGSTASNAFIAISAQMTEGSWRTEDRDGVPVYSAFSRSPHGLTVGLRCRARKWTDRSAASSGSSPPCGSRCSASAPALGWFSATSSCAP